MKILQLNQIFVTIILLIIGLNSYYSFVHSEEISKNFQSLHKISQSLTEKEGNPDRGRKILQDANNVTCLICHIVPSINEPDQGKIGPSLEGVGSRLTKTQIRLQLLNPKSLNPDSIMPSYYQTENLYRVAKSYVGKPIYTAQQIEDVISYLYSLKSK